MHVPRTTVAVIAINFVVFEEAMFLKRRARARNRRVHDESSLVEDAFCEV